MIDNYQAFDVFKTWKVRQYVAQLLGVKDHIAAVHKRQ